MPFPDITITPETAHKELLDKLQRFFVAAMQYWRKLNSVVTLEDGQIVIDYNDLINLPDFGTAAYMDVGTIAGTVAAGNDARFVDVPIDYNDLINTPTLGDAAALDVGTTAGTVAAGNDSRLVTHGDLHTHINGDGFFITEQALLFIDVLNKNVSTSKHGLCPKLPNDMGMCLNGIGNWSQVFPIGEIIFTNEDINPADLGIVGTWTAV